MIEQDRTNLRILLVGEYSGVHSTLRNALAAKGHAPVLLSDGDGYKGFDRDLIGHAKNSGIGLPCIAGFSCQSQGGKSDHVRLIKVQCADIGK